MDFWKTLGAPIIVGVILGVFGFLGGRITVADSPIIEATYRSTEIENPLYYKEARLINNLSQAISEITKAANIIDYVFDLRTSPKLAIGTIKITNNSNIRTKQIEVKRNSAIFVSDQAKDHAYKIARNEITIRPIDPSSSVNIEIIYPFLYAFDISQIQILHSDKKIDLADMTIKAEEFNAAFINAAIRFPFSFFLISMFALLFSVIFLLMTTFGIVISYNVKVRAKLTSKKEVAEFVRLLEYLRENDPLKLPEGLQWSFKKVKGSNRT